MFKNKNIILVLVALALSSSLFGGNKAKKIPVTTKRPVENRVYPIAIIGAGAGGTMAVKRAVLNNREVLLFTGSSKEIKRSRGNWVRQVDNVPGLEKYERAVVELRNETLKELVKSPLGHNLFVIPESVTGIKKEANLFQLRCSSGETFLARHVVMATGMMDEQPHIDGSIKPVLPYANRQKICYCLMCDGHRSFQKRVVVFGHSDEAASGAILLSDRYNPQKVTLLTNGKKPQFSQTLLNQLQAKKIDVEEGKIKKILGNKKELKGFQLSNKEVAADIGFVLLGMRPNNGLALELGCQVDDRGMVVTDDKCESTLPNLFVVGDVRANSQKQIYTAWQHAVEAVGAIDKRIRTEQ